MRTLARLTVSAVLAFSASLMVAALFLPVYGIFEGGSHNCLTGGIGECTSMILMSALIYGPLFSLICTPISTPVFMVILAGRN